MSKTLDELQRKDTQRTTEEESEKAMSLTQSNDSTNRTQNKTNHAISEARRKLKEQTWKKRPIHPEKDTRSPKQKQSTKQK